MCVGQAWFQVRALSAIGRRAGAWSRHGCPLAVGPAYGPLLVAPSLLWGLVRFEEVLPASHGHRSLVKPVTAITLTVFFLQRFAELR